jgi:hypothetical protein
VQVYSSYVAFTSIYEYAVPCSSLLHCTENPIYVFPDMKQRCLFPNSYINRNQIFILDSYWLFIRSVLFREPPELAYRFPSWTTLQRQNTEISKQIFPEKEYRGLSPNFYIHAFVSDLYIPTIGLPILLEEICRPILGLYKSLTDT